MLLQRIKNRLKVFASNATGGFYCPNCGTDRPTAHLHLMRDKIYKKDAFYIKCERCKNTTPAGDINMVIDNWDDRFIDKELAALELYNERSEDDI